MSKRMSFEDLLAGGGTLVYRIRGVSMEPMLRQDRDLVIIRGPSSRLRKYDVALYKRGDACVLHRVIRVEEDGYLIRGDHTYAPERVPDRAVIGVLTSFRRKGKDIAAGSRGYRLYVRLWTLIYPLRFACARLRRFAGRALRKVSGRGGGAA